MTSRQDIRTAWDIDAYRIHAPNLQTAAIVAARLTARRDAGRELSASGTVTVNGTRVRYELRARALRRERSRRRRTRSRRRDR